MTGLITSKARSSDPILERGIQVLTEQRLGGGP
jgi:hypothetical protein